MKAVHVHATGALLRPPYDPIRRVWIDPVPTSKCSKPGRAGKSATRSCTASAENDSSSSRTEATTLSFGSPLRGRDAQSSSNATGNTDGLDLVMRAERALNAARDALSDVRDRELAGPAFMPASLVFGSSIKSKQPPKPLVSSTPNQSSSSSNTASARSQYGASTSEPSSPADMSSMQAKAELPPVPTTDGWKIPGPDETWDTWDSDSWGYDSWESQQMPAFQVRSVVEQQAQERAELAAAQRTATAAAAAAAAARFNEAEQSASRRIRSLTYENTRDGNGTTSTGRIESRENDRLPAFQVRRQVVTPAQEQAILHFKEAEPVAELNLRSQLDSDRARASRATLPQWQSIVELTTAHLAPEQQTRTESVDDAETALSGQAVGVRDASAAGHILADGAGTLADGSAYERVSGEEQGANGYWCRWWVLRGTSDAGAVEWEERWWQASDWSGLREMGAEKTGCNTVGAAWREAWTEKIYYTGGGEPCVERGAHKWARADEDCKEEWEERWGEFYNARGVIDKWANKWGRKGPLVWHEKWGEKFEINKHCSKWTDRWSEEDIGDGRQLRKGDKWSENFGDGKGAKTGEEWHVDENGHRYQRTWGENHFGDGWVQKYGSSTTGEYWDTTEQSGTVYNPIADFGFDQALNQSPELLNIPTRPRESSADDLASGMDDF